jgi:addiction module RelB/DinJ family antitoxin
MRIALMMCEEVSTLAQTNINIRMDVSLKHDFDAACAEVGLSTTAVFTAFVKAVAEKRVIPFEISSNRLPSDITLASEKALAKDWLLPEEDEAWANL